MGRSDDGSREFARRAIGREASERAARDRGRGTAGAGGADLVVLRDRGGDRPAGRLHGRAACSGPRPLPGGLRRRRPGLRPASTRRGRRELLGRQAAWRRQSALRDRPLRPAVVGTGTDAPHSRRSRALRPVPGRQLRFGGTRLLSDDGRQSARRLRAAGRPPGAADAARRRGPDPPRWRRALAGAAVLARLRGQSARRSGYLDFVTLFASHGYVVAAPFHGDRRCRRGRASTTIGEMSSRRSWASTGFVAMQALRPTGLVATLDRLLAHPQWRDVVDVERIGGFGASLGGEAMMLLGGAGLTTSIGQSSKRVLIEPRLTAAVGYIPYFGQSILPRSVATSMASTASACPISPSPGLPTHRPVGGDRGRHGPAGSTRQLVTMRGVQHGLEARDLPDILTWSLAFLDGRVRRVTRRRCARSRPDDERRRRQRRRDDARLQRADAGHRRRAHRRRVPQRRARSLLRHRRARRGGDARHRRSRPRLGRTGFEFKAWARESGNGLPNCRFFGTPGSGPNSHFYTIDADECAKVNANPDWTFEEIVFAAGCRSASCARPTG